MRYAPARTRVVVERGQMNGPLDFLRADHIGSLGRPKHLIDAQLDLEAGNIDRNDLIAAQDAAIREVIDQHDAIGFPVATDGEFRRSNFQDSFGDSVVGYHIPQGSSGYLQRMDTAKSNLEERVPSGLSVAGPAVVTRRPAVSRLELVRNVPLEEYQFAASLTNTPVKATLIGPDRVAQRFDWQNSLDVYEGLDDFANHVASIQHDMVDQVCKSGCQYVQIDAPGYTAYVDPPSLAAMKSRGEDPQINLARSIKSDNDVIDGLEGITFGLHLCRGNERAIDPITGRVVPQWHREGHYDEIAEQLFTEIHHTRLLLEYDSDRAGDFRPLRFVPKGKIVVLGLVTTKSIEVEDPDDLIRRIDEASQFIPIEQLAISPQCGFSSSLGVSLSGDVQWRKLEVIQEVARRVWGKS